jgi:hypothetical protein
MDIMLMRKTESGPGGLNTMCRMRRGGFTELF